MASHLAGTDGHEVDGVALILLVPEAGAGEKGVFGENGRGRFEVAEKGVVDLGGHGPGFDFGGVGEPREGTSVV